MFCKMVVLCNRMWDGPNVWYDTEIKSKTKKHSKHQHECLQIVQNKIKHNIFDYNKIRKV